MTQQTYDTLVIGAGLDGLVVAAHLAKAGQRVLVLDGGRSRGGAAVTELFHPGFQAAPATDEIGYLSGKIVRELGLERFGYAPLPVDPLICHPLPDGDALTIWRDPGRTASEIARFSQADARRYPEFVALMGKLAAALESLLHITPFDLPSVGFSDLPELAGLGKSMASLGRKRLPELLRILPMPVSDLLNEWFESPVVKAALAAGSLLDISWGPMEAGTAYLFILRWATGSSGLFRTTAQLPGGPGAMGQAVAAAAAHHGAQIRTESRVSRIETRDGAATGVALGDGSSIEARRVVSALDPRTTFQQLLDPYYLDAGFVRHLHNIKYRGSTARLLLALDGLPQFTGMNGDSPGEQLSAAIQLASGIEDLQRAYDDSKYGRFSKRPFLDVRVPSLLDPGLAQEGGHVLTATVKYAPYHLREGDWAAQGQDLLETVLETLSAYAPAIREQVLAARLLTPADLERDFGLPEGSLNHGEMTLDQFFHMRPVPGWAQYRTPVEGLWLCGPGTHPGGVLTGISGRNAAREILRAKGTA